MDDTKEIQQPERRQIGPRVDAHLTRDIRIFCIKQGVDFQDFVEDALRAHYADVAGTIDEQNDDNE